MPASKIVNEQEVIKWFDEGRTYAWMQEQYQEKYGIETRLSMWGNFRRRHGLARRIARNDDLIPWEVKPEHRWDYPIMTLRKEARQREGLELSEEDQRALVAWKAGMERDGSVLHYDPDTEQGWFYVPRREGVDLDLIREPEHKTTRRHRYD